MQKQIEIYTNAQKKIEIDKIVKNDKQIKNNTN